MMCPIAKEWLVCWLSCAGATYPLSMTAQQLALRPEADTPDAGATIDGKPSIMGPGRRLARLPLEPPEKQPFLLSATIRI